MTNAATPLLLVVAGALRAGDGRVLLQRRAGDGAQAGLWEFPGGKIEPGETPEAALIRELEEELGIVVAAAQLAPVGFASERLGERHLLLMLFLIDHWRGKPTARVADALAWVAPADMAALPMPAPDYPLAHQLLRLTEAEPPRAFSR